MDPVIFSSLTSLLATLHKIRTDSLLRRKEKYEYATSLPLRHPKSVVVVTTKTKQQFPSLPGEMKRFHRLDEAIGWSNILTNFSISIVVDEGVYVDNICEWKYPESLALDIVGIGCVISVSLQYRIRFQGGALFMTNVQIVDCMVKSETTMVSVDSEASMHFTDVRFTMNAPEHPAIQMDRSAKAIFSNCLIEGGRWGFLFKDGVSVEFSKCLFRNIYGQIGRIYSYSSVSAFETTFENCGQLMLTNNAIATIQKCNFKCAISMWASKTIALVATSQSKLVVQETLIEQYPAAVSVERQSEAELTKCSIISCRCATEVSTSSNLKISDSKIFGPVLLKTFANEKGHIVFKDNKILSSLQPVLSIDQELPTSSLSHDFPLGSVKIELYQREQHLTDVFRFEKQKRLCRVDPDKNSCEKCCIEESGTEAKTESRAQFKKFKLCSYCKKVRYCSKKCQNDDWPDHIEVCRIYYTRTE